MQINRPNTSRIPHAGTSPPAGAQQQNRSTQTPPTPLRHTKRLSKKTMLIAGLLLAAVLVALGVWRYTSSQIMASRYQAVFLSNGQVYFGKLHGYYSDRPYMTDVYYFQANSQTSSSSPTQQSGGNQLLVKLGQEIHAPENKLILNKDSIMFVENLTDNGKVSEAIKKDAQGTGTTTEASGGISR